MNAITEIYRDRLTAKPGDALVRAVTAKVIDKVVSGGAERYLNGDEVTPHILRSNQTPGSTSASGWASQLAQTAVAQFILNLGPMSAASQLFALCLNMGSPRGVEQLNVPGVVPVGSAGGFVAELDPIPVVSWTFDAATLRAKKLAIVSVISREAARRANLEAQVRRLLVESTSLLLDSVLFSASAATTAAPAGLLHGVSETIPTGTFSDFGSAQDDLCSLIAAIAPVGGDRIAIVTSPARAAQIGMMFPQFRYPVLASSAVADTRIIAVAIDGLAFVIDPEPDIDVAIDAVVHMSDTPLEIVSDTGPATADPVRSLFQTDALGIRLMLDMDWAPRDPAAVAYLDKSLGAW